MKVPEQARAEASPSIAAAAAHTAASLSTSPEATSLRGVCLYRLPQVLARIPVSRSTWFAGIKAGRYPKGRSLGPRMTVWRSDEIDQIVLGVDR